MGRWSFFMNFPLCETVCFRDIQLRNCGGQRMRDGNKTQENLGESEVYGLDYICPVSFLKGICPLRVLSDTCDDY